MSIVDILPIIEMMFVVFIIAYVYVMHKRLNDVIASDDRVSEISSQMQNFGDHNILPLWRILDEKVVGWISISPEASKIRRRIIVAFKWLLISVLLMFVLCFICMLAEW